MLKNIPPCLSPELLKALDEMGHGDEIVIGDGNFPGSSLGPKVIRADGIGGEAETRTGVAAPCGRFFQENHHPRRGVSRNAGRVRHHDYRYL